MSQKRIAQVLRCAGILLPNDYTPEWNYDLRLNELAYTIDAELHPVIETVEQLDALPMGSVIRGKTSSYERFADGHWWGPSALLPVSLSELHVLVPARVLYTPEVADD